MNVDVVKPFPCKEVNCGASFFTEDHLAVHIQAKHTKLNLEISKASNNQIFADQTPTPTRLLNNCEELRVFDDLQNINPFEEGFRRACEDGSDHNSFLSVPTSVQDTLHTPIIAPPVEPQPQPEQRILENSASIIATVEKSADIPRPKVDEMIQVPTITITSSTTNQMIPIAPKPPQTVAITPHHPIALLPKPSIIYATPLIASNLTTATNTTINNSAEPKTSELVKSKLKNIILSNAVVQNDVNRIKSQNIQTLIIGTALPLIAAPANLIINSEQAKMDATYNNKSTMVEKPAAPQRKATKRTASESRSGGSQKTERNRAAAKRYRNKMKQQGEALKDKFERTQMEILTLRRENAELKKELLQVKSLLLMHKNCPITTQQQPSMNIHESNQQPQLLL